MTIWQAMDFLNTNYWAEHIALATAIVAALGVLISAVADRRRHNRKRIEDVGFMPWTGITVFGVLVAVMAVAFAIKGG